MVNNWKQFNEAKKDVRKKFKMTDTHRKNIVRKANKMMKEKEKDFDELAPGKKESLQDDYIKKVCKEMGYDYKNFYSTDGKKLNKLLGLNENDEFVDGVEKNITAEEIVDDLATKMGVSRSEATNKLIELGKELDKLKKN